jgi:flagellar biosynthetic protein FliO
MGTTPDADFILYYKVLGSLLLVLALLFLVAFGLKRWNRFFGTSAPGDRIQVVSRLPLSPKHSLVLIQVQEQQLLLGIAPDGIRLLTAVEKAAAAQEQELPSPPENEPKPRFQTILNRFIGPKS